jgi:hypothetical protein
MQRSVRDDTREMQHEGGARTFAELMYRYRLAVGLSRLEVAERVLCSENYVYWLESRDPRHSSRPNAMDGPSPGRRTEAEPEPK